MRDCHGEKRAVSAQCISTLVSYRDALLTESRAALLFEFFPDVIIVHLIPRGIGGLPESESLDVLHDGLELDRAGLR